ncbi:hypothetical protein, partial [Salinimicrobium oceani]
SISRQEWDEGFNNSFGDYANQDDFDRFDKDRSGDLSNTEWNEGVAGSNWFGTFDEDQNSTISNQEWARRDFAAWDINKDGKLDQQEFQSYNSSKRNNGNMNSGNRTNSQT